MAELKTSLMKVRDMLGEVAAYQETLTRAAASQADAAAERRQAEWLGAMTEAALIVASADGQLSDVEKKQMSEGLVSLTDGKVSEQDVLDMIERVTAAVHEEGPSKRFHEIATILADSPLREAVFLIACAVAWRDRGINERQGLAVRALGHAFGFSEGKLQSLLAKAKQAL